MAGVLQEMCLRSDDKEQETKQLFNLLQEEKNDGTVAHWLAKT